MCQMMRTQAIWSEIKWPLFPADTQRHGRRAGAETATEAAQTGDQQEETPTAARPQAGTKTEYSTCLVRTHRSLLLDVESARFTPWPDYGDNRSVWDVIRYRHVDYISDYCEKQAPAPPPPTPPPASPGNSRLLPEAHPGGVGQRRLQGRCRRVRPHRLPASGRQVTPAADSADGQVEKGLQLPRVRESGLRPGTVHRLRGCRRILDQPGSVARHPGRDFPGMDGPLKWLTLALLAVPGTVRAAFLIALGPNRIGEWSEVWESPEPEPTATRPASATPTPAPAPPAPAPVDAPAARRWWKLRMRVRSEFTSRRRRLRRTGGKHPSTGGHMGKFSTRRAGQLHPTRPAPTRPPSIASAQSPAPKRSGSAAGTVVKILAVLALFTVCGGYWLTGGSFVDPSDTTTEPPRLRNVAEKRHMLDLINEARVQTGVPPVAMGTNNVAQIQADQLLEDCV